MKINVKENSVAIVGWHEGAAGQIHSWLEKYSDYHIACFINPDDKAIDIDSSQVDRDVSQFAYPTKDSFKDKPMYNSSNWTEILSKLNIKKVLVTTVEGQDRLEHINLARNNGFQLINAIHPTALIMEDAILYDNIVLHARAFVGYRAELFPGAVIDIASQVGHHNVIRECVTIDPGVTLAGNVTIDQFASLHTGVIAKNRIKIGENSIIGAGTVLIKDVPANVTIVGVPGRIIKL
jgi:acetyltransferase-like isoleucine patch superfamily enzyme